MENELVCETFILGPLQVNSYLVFDSESQEGLVIDPAYDDLKFIERIDSLSSYKFSIFLTHGHADHILGLETIRKLTRAKVFCGEEDSKMLLDPILNLSQWLGSAFVASPADAFLKQGDHLSLGKHKGEVLSIPGHTPGSIVLCFPTMIFTGDTLFAGSIGRTDFPNGNGKLLISMIKERILTLSNRTVFFGYVPAKTIEEVKGSNFFLQETRFDF
ncbi:MBL fold metallo-hydrolase [bacterium]|nr:MBL fold metallo-hydrolase [bacterium]